MRPVTREHLFSPHPLALLLAPLAAGILLAHFFTTHLAALIGLAAVSSLFSLWFLLARREIWSTALIVLATLFAGGILESLEQRPAPTNQIKRLIEEGVIKPGDPVELMGMLDRPLENTPDSFYVTIRVEQLRLKNIERKASGIVQLLAPLHDLKVSREYDELELHYGARVRVMVGLERADNYHNPGVSSFTEFLDRNGFDATGKLKSPLLLERLDNERVFLPLLWLYEWRHQLERQIKQHFSVETAGVLDAALLGNRYHLSRQASERFREGGTFHVLVISGLHISFIGGLVLVMTQRFTKRRWLQFVLPTVVLWGYTLAVGAESSVVRAALMFTMVALAPVVSRRANSLNALGGAGLVLLLWQPRDLFDPSFQLTFMSVLSIVIIAAPLLYKLSAIGQWQPTRATPCPPACPAWLRRGCEVLYWSEQEWRAEMASSNYSYQLFKSPVAVRLERYGLQWLLRYGAAALVVSAGVQVAMLPLMILYFHRLSFAALVLNIFVSVLMALLGIVALAGLALVQISAVAAAPLITLANTINWMMVHSVDLFARLGIQSLRLPEYAGWPAAIYCVYYLPLAFLIWRLTHWQPLLQKPRLEKSQAARATMMAVLLQLALSLLLVAHPWSARRPDGRLRVDFLDVGQGDAALVTLPDGTTLLVDGGGRPSFGGRKASAATTFSAGLDDEAPFERDTRSIGEAVVSEYLWWRGLDHVDYILATHADADHMDGLNDVARNFQVRAALVARTPGADPEYLKFSESLRRNQIPVNVIGADDVLRFGSVTATTLWPPHTTDSKAPSRNNDSIVLRLQYGERTILLTGDVEKEGEAAILKANSNLASDVVKVPHHGSKTSSTDGFVSATHPQLALISVGLTSMFGHPHQEVVDRWKSSGADVVTTGRQGTITVSTDGKDLRVESFIK